MVVDLSVGTVFVSRDGANTPTLALVAGTYTVEVAGSGTFTISRRPATDAYGAVLAA